MHSELINCAKALMHSESINGAKEIIDSELIMEAGASLFRQLEMWKTQQAIVSIAFTY